jgi:hypothetical protein
MRTVAAVSGRQGHHRAQCAQHRYRCACSDHWHALHTTLLTLTTRGRTCIVHVRHTPRPAKNIITHGALPPAPSWDVHRICHHATTSPGPCRRRAAAAAKTYMLPHPADSCWHCLALPAAPQPPAHHRRCCLPWPQPVKANMAAALPGQTPPSTAPGWRQAPPCCIHPRLTTQASLLAAPGESNAAGCCLAPCCTVW